MSLNTPLSKVRGLGSAKEGSHHWWVQRMTALALIPLTLWFVFAVAVMAGQDHATMIAWAAEPFNAVMLLLLVVLTFHHTQLGLQVVIEDYVHGHASKLFLMFANTFGCWIGGLICVLAVLKIAFGG